MHQLLAGGSYGCSGSHAARGNEQSPDQVLRTRAGRWRDCSVRRALGIAVQRLLQQLETLLRTVLLEAALWRDWSRQQRRAEISPRPAARPARHRAVVRAYETPARALPTSRHAGRLQGRTQKFPQHGALNPESRRCRDVSSARHARAALATGVLNFRCPESCAAARNATDDATFAAPLLRSGGSVRA